MCRAAATPCPAYKRVIPGHCAANALMRRQRKRSAAGQSIRLRSLYFRAAGQANTASYCCAAGGAAFCLSFAILSSDGFGFARRFSRELIGVTDGVVFDLTRLFDYAVTFLLCVLLHRIGSGFRLLGDGVRLLVRLGLDGAGLILQAIGLGVSPGFSAYRFAYPHPV